jgi:hypothetical protein
LVLRSANNARTSFSARGYYVLHSDTPLLCGNPPDSRDDQECWCGFLHTLDPWNDDIPSRELCILDLCTIVLSSTQKPPLKSLHNLTKPLFSIESDGQLPLCRPHFHHVFSQGWSRRANAAPRSCDCYLGSSLCVLLHLPPEPHRLPPYHIQVVGSFQLPLEQPLNVMIAFLVTSRTLRKSRAPTLST